MPNPVFPTLSVGQDSKKYQVTKEDVSLQTPMDGGYVVSRAKYTRLPRKTFKVGYTALLEADKTLLDDFWDAVRGGSVVFQWANSEDGQQYFVRFSGSSTKGLTFQYVGRGIARLWNVEFELQQA